MITSAAITRRASHDVVPARTVERDYVLAHILASLAARPRNSGLVFKGGTAMRMCYIDDFRYSADLDFSLVSGSAESALAVIEQSLNEIDSSIATARLSSDRPPRITYVGPLARERTIKLDISDDELVLHTEARALLRRWPDIEANRTITVYSPLEIAGEKLRCVLQRVQCRDLFDLRVLFEDLGVDAVEASNVFHSKALHKGIDPSIFADRYAARLEQYSGRWTTELEAHVLGDVPHFQRVERAVSRHLRRVGMI